MLTQRPPHRVHTRAEQVVNDVAEVNIDAKLLARRQMADEDEAYEDTVVRGVAARAGVRVCGRAHEKTTRVCVWVCAGWKGKIRTERTTLSMRVSLTMFVAHHPCLSVQELENGCACCTAGPDLMDSILKLVRLSLRFHAPSMRLCTSAIEDVHLHAFTFI